MSNDNDVIVFDEEYKYASKVIKEYAAALTKMITEYSTCVNNILDETIKDEKISSGLKEIVEQVKGVMGDIRTICVEASDACSEYVVEIDAVDNFLYQGDVIKNG